MNPQSDIVLFVFILGLAFGFLFLALWVLPWLLARLRRPKSWQRYIHIASIIGQGVGLWIALKYLPPWLSHNPGVLLFCAVIMAQDILHFFLHDK